jgi:hypothetical protein
MTAVLGSGIKIMSDSLIPFQPAIEEPSNILPSVKNPSSTKRRDGDVLLLTKSVSKAKIGELSFFFGLSTSEHRRESFVSSHA